MTKQITMRTAALTKQITISVTKEDIESGHPCNSSRCPVALAIQRAINVSTACIRVTTTECEIMREHGLYEYCDLPASAKAFVKGFDNEKPGDPFTFTMEYPQ